MRCSRAREFDGTAGLERDCGVGIVIKKMITRVGRNAPSFIIKNSVWISHVLHVDVPVRGEDIPISRNQTQSKAASSHRRADVALSSDAAHPIGEHVMTRNIPSGSDRHISGFRSESACTPVELGIVIIVLDREVTGYVSPCVDRHVSPGSCADPSQVQRVYPVIRSGSLSKNVAIKIAAAVYVAKFGRDVDVPAVES